MIDRCPDYKALGSTFIPRSKSYNQTRLGLEFQIKQNPYTKRFKITTENIEPPLRNRPGHRHRSIGNLHAFLQSHRQISCYGHRQTLILIIGKNLSPPLDLVTFNRLFIGNYPHRQLFCRLVTVAPPADLYSTGLWVRVQKWCQQRG